MLPTRLVSLMQHPARLGIVQTIDRRKERILLKPFIVACSMLSKLMVQRGGVTVLNIIPGSH